jgi:hypothetical protein
MRPGLTDERWAPFSAGLQVLEGFRTLWADHKVKEKTQGLKRIDHPTVGELLLTFERLALADDDEQTLIAYTAEPGSPTAERLAVPANWTAVANPDAEAPRREDVEDVEDTA